MDERDAVTLGLSAVLLGEVDEEQLPLLDVLGADLVHAKGRSSDDGSLGFGVADVAWLTAVVPVAGVVVDFLLDVLKDAVKDTLKDRVTAVLGALGRRRKAPDQLPPDVVNRAQDVAFRHARTVGLDEPRARLLAAAVAGSLAGHAG
jgi:hypothetical protein